MQYISDNLILCQIIQCGYIAQYEETKNDHSLLQQHIEWKQQRSEANERHKKDGINKVKLDAVKAEITEHIQEAKRHPTMSPEDYFKLMACFTAKTLVDNLQDNQIIELFGSIKTDESQDRFRFKADDYLEQLPCSFEQFSFF